MPSAPTVVVCQDIAWLKEKHKIYSGNLPGQTSLKNAKERKSKWFAMTKKFLKQYVLLWFYFQKEKNIADRKQERKLTYKKI